MDPGADQGSTAIYKATVPGVLLSSYLLHPHRRYHSWLTIRFCFVYPYISRVMLLKFGLLGLALGTAWTNASANIPSQDQAGDLHGRDASPDPPPYPLRPFIGVPIDSSFNRLAADGPSGSQKEDHSKEPFRPDITIPSY